MLFVERLRDAAGEADENFSANFSRRGVNKQETTERVHLVTRATRQTAYVCLNAELTIDNLHCLGNRFSFKWKDVGIRSCAAINSDLFTFKLNMYTYPQSGYSLLVHYISFRNHERCDTNFISLFDDI